MGSTEREAPTTAFLEQRAVWHPAGVCCEIRTRRGNVHWGLWDSVLRASRAVHRNHRRTQDVVGNWRDDHIVTSCAPLVQPEVDGLSCSPMCAAAPLVANKVGSMVSCALSYGFGGGRFTVDTLELSK